MRDGGLKRRRESRPTSQQFGTRQYRSVAHQDLALVKISVRVKSERGDVKICVYLAA
jgi:hypothetical protein